MDELMGLLRQALELGFADVRVQQSLFAPGTPEDGGTRITLWADEMDAPLTAVAPTLAEATADMVAQVGELVA